MGVSRNFRFQVSRGTEFLEGHSWIVGSHPVRLRQDRHNCHRPGENSSRKVWDYKKATEDDIDAKKDDTKKKQEKVVALTDELTELEDDKKTTSKTLASAKDQLTTLSKKCVEGEETYEERVAARQKEIEALKRAQNILEDWKN